MRALDPSEEHLQGDERVESPPGPAAFKEILIFVLPMFGSGVPGLVPLDPDHNSVQFLGVNASGALIWS